MKNAIASLALASVMIAGCSNSDIASVGVAEAQANGGGCSLIGSWFGFDPLYPGEDIAWWTATHQGQNQSGGTSLLEVPGFDVKLTLPDGTQLAPTAERGSISRGAWRRQGDNAFEISGIALVVDADDELVYTFKWTGTNYLDAGCDCMTVTGTMEFFARGVNPLSGEPFLTLPAEPHKGYRITSD